MNLIAVFVFLAASSCGPQPSPGSLKSAPTAAQAKEVSAKKTSSQKLSGDDVDPPEVSVGHRLFQETRFAQYFRAHSPDNVNQPLSGSFGDSAMYFTQTLAGGIPGAYRGKTMSCAVCHLVDEHRSTAGGGMRAYTDFARRSPIPDRGDGRTTTARNTPTMVNASVPREGPLFLHGDGQFISLQGLVEGGLTGRNFGWLPGEEAQAIAQIAKIIREDDGSGDLAQKYYGAYRTVLEGSDRGIPERFRIPEEYRIQVSTATDERIFHVVSKLIAVYSDSLRYSRDSQGNYNGSPYDLFLSRNQLPRKPDAGESPKAYAGRLAQQLVSLRDPVFVTESDGQYAYQSSDHHFKFGPPELQGLRLFLAPARSSGIAGQSAGNCASCHAPPHFTDFKFHNTGAAQDEFDRLHGRGSFVALQVPGLSVRNRTADLYLPPSDAHPGALGVFDAVPSKDDPMKTDLGLWNMFANPNFPGPQESLRTLLCPQGGCDDETLLGQALAAFKTPSLRDLGQSAPYMHTGQKDRLEDVLALYIKSSVLQRQGKLRNGDPEIGGIQITGADVGALASFLDSLNEDYH